MKQSSAMQNFTENAKRIREASGLTIQALADRIGMKRPDLSVLLSGHHSPTLETMERIAHGLGVQVYDLVKPPEAEAQGQKKAAQVA